MNGIWITWELQRRNKGISSALGWDLYEITRERSGPIRYLLSVAKTVGILLKRRPPVVGAQNPSIVLALLVVLLKRVFGYVLLIDAHNSGIFPAEGSNRLLMGLSRFIQKRADVTLVTNGELARVVEKNRGRGVVLPDRIPDVPQTKPFAMEGRINIAFVCTFSDDEPYVEVIQSAYRLPEDTVLYVTGTYQGHVDQESLPSNVRLLGFIPDADYWNLLASVDLIVDLTTREGCLVCGAYEGIALNKPLVLSDTRVTRSYFSMGCVYVKSDAISIAEGMMEAIHTRDKMASAVRHLGRRISLNWNERLKYLENRMRQLVLGS